MFAAVDLGSNSFRLHVGEPAGGEIRILRSARDPVRLAAGLDASGRLGEAAIGIERYPALIGKSAPQQPARLILQFDMEQIIVRKEGF